jgi:hypothetical protein
VLRIPRLDRHCGDIELAAGWLRCRCTWTLPSHKLPVHPGHGSLCDEVVSKNLVALAGRNRQGPD